MQTVLSQLNSVPGVIGSLVADTGGKLVAHAFPSLFDGAMLEDAARVILDGAAGLDLAPGRTELVEFRFADAILFVKPLPGGVFVVLATKGTNAHFLGLSVSLASAKIAKLRPMQPAATASVAPAAPSTTPRVAPPTKGLDELRRRLTAAPNRADPPRDPSITMPLDLPGGDRSARPSAAVKPKKG